MRGLRIGNLITRPVALTKLKNVSVSSLASKAISCGYAGTVERRFSSATDKRVEEELTKEQKIKEIINETRGSQEAQLSVAELEAVYQQFCRRSATKQELTLEEFRVAIKTMGVTDSDALAERYFAVFDTNGDGRVDLREWASGLSLLSKGSVEEKYQFIFNVWDTSGDGRIDLEEFRNWLKATSPYRGETLEKIAKQTFSDLDINQDHSLTFQELKKGIAKISAVAPLLPFEGDSWGHLSHPEVQILTLIGERQKFRKGERVIVDGEKSDAVYVLLQGRVSLSKRGHPISVAENIGDTFAEESLVDCESIVDAVVSEDCELIKVSCSELLPLIFHDHRGSTDFAERSGEQLVHRVNAVETVVHGTPEIANNKQDVHHFGKVRDKILHQWALAYHSLGVNGKIAITSTKKVGTPESLAIAYSPGVAEPCLAIESDAETAYDYTSKGHLVGVVSNGTAVLGLGDIGALASKPVMEGKAVLFKTFGGLDSFDIEVAEREADKFIDIAVAISPTFGGMNLEDIKAPECFYIEPEVQRRCDIPVMHDDQHGTSVVAGAGLLNALEVIGKKIEDIKVVVCGLGAAGFTATRYFKALGVKKENMIGVDMHGVVYKGRDDLKGDFDYLNEVARDIHIRSLAEAVEGADVFLGVSAGGLLKPSMLESMNDDPLVFALANPTPEISFHVARKTRSDVIMGTGRSDYPNQVNNVAAFPYIFRGAIDVRSTAINEEMKKAATKALANIPKIYCPEIGLKFSKDYIIPKPFDKRLLPEVAAAVAQAAIDSGVSRVHKFDIQEYKDKLTQ